MRYTEARMTHLGRRSCRHDKDTVDFVPNYDETRTEPRVFPAAFPNLLVNGDQYRVGMAPTWNPTTWAKSSMASAPNHNPEISIAELMKT